MNFEDDEDEQPVFDDSVVATGLVEDTHKHPTQHHTKTKNPDQNKQLNEQQTNISEAGQPQQQDEWEEFEDPNAKYEQLRLKLSRGNNDDDNEDEYYDDENNPNNNDVNNDLTGDREQQKDKPVWKTNQATQEQTETTAPIVEEQPPPPSSSKPSTTSGGVYRAPAFRSGTSVTVVSGATQQRVSKKKEPNFASTDDFPTLGSTANKK
jgi:hypothetical protein